MRLTIEREDEDDLDPPADDTTTVRRVLGFAAVLVVLLLVHTLVLEPVRVRSDSMEPALRAGAVVLVDKVTFRARQPRRGELIVAADPRSGESIVKRIVAIAGDSVGIENGLLVLNGKTIAEKYIANDNMQGFYFGPDVVPTGQVFVLGDNRDTSVDSRAFGPLDVSDIEGRVVATIWPPG